MPEDTPEAPRDRVGQPARMSRGRGSDLLLYMLRPEPAAVEGILPLLREVRDTVGDVGRCMSPDRLHVTLFPLGYHDGLPQALVDAAIQAGDSVDAEPFGVRFDQLRPFFDPGARRHRGAALFGGGPGLRRFRRLLGGSLESFALHSGGTIGGRPHVSLYYGGVPVPARTVEPMHWWVREFCLVHSPQGQSRHGVLQRWPLRGRQAALDWD